MITITHDLPKQPEYHEEVWHNIHFTVRNTEYVRYFYLDHIRFKEVSPCDFKDLFKDGPHRVFYEDSEDGWASPVNAGDNLDNEEELYLCLGNMVELGFFKKDLL